MNKWIVLYIGIGLIVLGIVLIATGVGAPIGLPVEVIAILITVGAATALGAAGSLSGGDIKSK